MLTLLTLVFAVVSAAFSGGALLVLLFVFSPPVADTLMRSIALLRPHMIVTQAAKCCGEDREGEVVEAAGSKALAHVFQAVTEILFVCGPYVFNESGSGRQ